MIFSDMTVGLLSSVQIETYVRDWSVSQGIIYIIDGNCRMIQHQYQSNATDM